MPRKPTRMVNRRRSDKRTEIRGRGGGRSDGETRVQVPANRPVPNTHEMEGLGASMGTPGRRSQAPYSSSLQAGHNSNVLHLGDRSTNAGTAIPQKATQQ